MLSQADLRVLALSSWAKSPSRPVVTYFTAFWIVVSLCLLVSRTSCLLALEVSDCHPLLCNWVHSEKEERLAVVCNVVLLVNVFLVGFFFIYDDPSYNCPEFACNGLRKLLKILILVGQYLVILLIYRDLINGVCAEKNIMSHLFPACIIWVLAPIHLFCQDFCCELNFGKARKNTRNHALRTSRGKNFHSHASHLGDLGSAPVLLFPIFVMLVMIMMQCDPIIVTMTMFCWVPITVCWDSMFSFRPQRRTWTAEYKTPRFTYSRGAAVITVQSLEPFLSLTFSQKILLRTGCKIHHFVSQLPLKSRVILNALCRSSLCRKSSDLKRVMQKQLM